MAPPILMATWQCPVCDRIQPSPAAATRGGCTTCAPDGTPIPEIVASGVAAPESTIDDATLTLLRWSRGALIALAVLSAALGGILALLSYIADHPWIALLQLGGTSLTVILMAANAALIRVVLLLDLRTRAMSAGP